MRVNDARLWHPWLRINRVLRVMLHTRWTVAARAFMSRFRRTAVRGIVNAGVPERVARYSR